MRPVLATPTAPTPGQHRRRYPSDTTDQEWALIEPLLPSPACTLAKGGRPEAHPRREVIDAIRYLVHNGCVWRALPADFPPWPTVYGFFARWAADGTLDRVHATLRKQVRAHAGRHPQPSAAVIDSQSVRAVAQAQATEQPAGQQPALRPPTERQVGEPWRHGEAAFQEQAAADAPLRRVLARERFSIPSQTPDQPTAPAPPEPSGQSN